MNLAVRTGSPVRVTSATSKIPRPVVISTQRHARVATISYTREPSSPATTISTRSPLMIASVLRLGALQPVTWTIEYCVWKNRVVHVPSGASAARTGPSVRARDVVHTSDRVPIRRGPHPFLTMTRRGTSGVLRIPIYAANPGVRALGVWMQAAVKGFVRAAVSKLFPWATCRVTVICRWLHGAGRRAATAATSSRSCLTKIASRSTSRSVASRSARSSVDSKRAASAPAEASAT